MSLEEEIVKLTNSIDCLRIAVENSNRTIDVPVEMGNAYAKVDTIPEEKMETTGMAFKTASEKPAKRKRRTKAQIEADEAANKALDPQSQKAVEEANAGIDLFDPMKKEAVEKVDDFLSTASKEPEKQINMDQLRLAAKELVDCDGSGPGLAKAKEVLTAFDISQLSETPENKMNEVFRAFKEATLQWK
jgi:hypothetical protein